MTAPPVPSAAPVRPTAAGRPALRSVRRSWVPTPRWAAAGAGLLLGGAFAAGAAGVPLAAAGAVAVAAVLVAADRRPRAATWAAVVALALVPVYWVPAVPGGTLALPPALGAAAVLAVAWRHHVGSVRLDAVDAVVALHAGLALVAHVVTFGPAYQGLATEALLGPLLPYAAFRLAATGGGPVLRRAVLGSLAGLATLAVVERSTGRNPFALAGDRGRLTPEAGLLERFGGVRAEVSFGQPVALSLALAMGSVALAGLAVHRRSWAAGGLSALCGAGVLATQSRTGMGAAAAGLLVLLVGSLRSGGSRRLLMGLAVAAAVLWVAGGQHLRTIAGSVQGPSAEAATVSHRRALLDTLGDASHASLLGRRADDGLDTRAEVVGSRSPTDDVANQYVNLWLFEGAVPTGLFLLLLPLSLARVARGRDAAAQAWWAAAVAGLVGLVGVTLLAQLHAYFWAFVAAAPRDGDT